MLQYLCMGVGHAKLCLDMCHAAAKVEPKTCMIGRQPDESLLASVGATSPCMSGGRPWRKEAKTKIKKFVGVLREER